MEKLPDYRGELKPTAWSRTKPAPRKKPTKPEFTQSKLFDEKPSQVQKPKV